MILQDTDNAEKVHCCVTPPPRPPRFCLRPIRPEREPLGVPWGRSIIYQKFTKNIRDAEKWWCIFSFARDCLLQYVPPTLESNIRRKKKKRSSWWSTSYISEFMIIKRSCKTISKRSASFLSLQVWLVWLRATSMLSCQGREVQILGGADRWRDSCHTVNIFFFFFSSA